MHIITDFCLQPQGSQQNAVLAETVINNANTVTNYNKN